MQLTQAQALFQAGKWAEAAALCREWLQQNPRDAAGNHLLGTILLQAGQLEDAEHYAKSAIVSDIRAVPGHILLGKVYLAQGNRVEATKAFERALVVAPGDLEAFRERIHLALTDGHYDDAERILAPMLARYPDVPELLALMVQVRKEQKRYADVVALGDRILALRPDFADEQFLIRYALALADTGRLKDSVHYHLHLIERLRREATPQNLRAVAEIQYNVALAYDNLGQFDKAADYYQQALAICPDHHTCRFAYETLLIKTSDLQRDLSSFSLRFLMRDRKGREYPFPQWRGESLDGKRLLIWGEQGIGDVAMFAGFLPYIIPKLAHLTIDMFPLIAPIFRRSFPDAEVIESGPAGEKLKDFPAGAFDYHAPLGDLMVYLLKDYKPRSVKAYLKPEPNRFAQLKARYEALGPGLKVGISWRTIAVTRFRRDIPLELWGPILQVPGVHFISLQYTNEEAEIAMAKQAFGIDILLDKDVHPLESKEDFLAQIAAMDLVISIQNSAVHMGGAAGTDTILMLSKTGDFRWGVTPVDSVFYPSVSILRQPEYGDWSPVIDHAAGLLREKAARR